MFYKLNELREPVQIRPEEIIEDLWDIKNRRVALTTVGDVDVSTVFLVVDHNPFGDGPVVFETMIFDEQNGNESYRFCTWREAEEWHWKTVKKLVDIKNEILEMTKDEMRYDFEALKKESKNSDG